MNCFSVSCLSTSLKMRALLAKLTILFSISSLVNSTPALVPQTIPVASLLKWPPTCCLKLFGCEVADLLKYCPSCPNICNEINKCDCYFPGTKEIIKRRPIDTTPRPPFCPECSQRKCNNNCPPNLIECTLDNARAFIAD
ncbi:hypothetical protein Bhyg_09536 [Pseudolycoriella hygida]|uniref:Uncharacterized protein n=1 Tax=Pseudolycoriella hygida TaxID=35572 RepID=A0A9Q0N7F7_9DIPT|nr:hypothetical protein Bhyg_09536 [Pseudolycoriella hygida]